jgi:hypothetical protein
MRAFGLVAAVMIGGVSIVGVQKVATDKAVNEIIQPGASLESAISAVAMTSGVPIGFERRYLPGEVVERVTVTSPIDLRELKPQAAVSLILRGHPWYSFREHMGVILIRQSDSDGNHVPTFVDGDLRQIELTDVTLPAALDRLLAALLPGFPAAKPPSTMSQSGLITRQFSVPKGDYRLVDLLAAIVTQHGSAGWIVSYRNINVDNTEPDPVITFYTFDGTSVGRSLPGRRLARP